ncbi:c-type cytochrome [Hymenobacter rubripertinctus]|uniref:Cytochrome c n=1 Tax=Hymenobacter rubripertinctus TaxID=2029981 RepID=A0A418QY12_9BACT|nr:cytochrome c [Hymenobacter rubripertinctus]RIY10055.1 cytochrome c [Hymenobacter rubripertinctus]
MLRLFSLSARPAAPLVAALLLSACGPAPDASQTSAAPPPPAAAPEALEALEAGASLFAQNCAICHGASGKLGLNGAHDLTKSNLNAAGRTYMVVNGLGKMPGFRGQLTDEQIQQVVAYSLTLK